MIGLWNYICRLWKTKAYIDASVKATPWTAAGVLFTNGAFVLSGVQQCNDKHIVSGIGGTRESDESYLDTALREMVEELFDTIVVPKDLLDHLKRRFTPKVVFQNQGYISVVYTFKQLEQMLRIISKSGLQSRLYDTVPRTLHELMLYRFPCNDCELSRLLLVNLYPKRAYSSLVHRDFIEDLEAYKVIVHAQRKRSYSRSTNPTPSKVLTGLTPIVPSK